MVLAIGTLVAAEGFNYEDQAAWSDIAEVCGNGERQSPIDIITGDAVYDAEAGDLEYTNPTLVFGAVSNNGHTLQYTLNEESAANTFAEGVLSDAKAKFHLKQLHFHWGTTAADGSEHLVDGQSYPLEVHLVHLNNKYESIGEGASKKDGLAVIGLFFDETADDVQGTTSLQAIAEYAKLSGSAGHKNGVSTEEIALDLANLLDHSHILESKRFYTYEGSLTTPGCNQAVQWIVAETVGKVTTGTMENIRSASPCEAEDESCDDTTGIAPNFREPQPMLGRELKSSFTTGEN